MSTQDLNAIELLEEQHREVEQLFSALEDEESAEEKERLFAELADKLAVHATIEEKHFYPSVKARQTEDLLRESLEEHLGVKRIIADLLALEVEDPTFDAKVKVLQEQVEHHVEEEEEELFPQVQKLFGEEELIAMAQEMTATQVELEEQGNARMAIPNETGEAAPL